ncbi:hypothetical protein Tco_1075174, partial [Tanacetum coccineum]
MFEPHVEDTVWRNQQDYKVMDWKLYDSCGVHSLRMQHVHIHMLVEKKYPLIPSTLSMMLKKKLQIDYESEMAYQLLKFIGKIVKIKSLLDAVRIIAAQVYVNTALMKYVVPTGRVVVPTGKYVVPVGKVIIIVSPGRLSLVPTGRVLSPGSDNESDDASVHSEATIPQQQRNIQPQIITTVSNSNAKSPYLKKDEYESIPNDHVANFHYMDDARDIWNAVKARFGGNAVSKKMRKFMLKQEFSEFRISEAEGLHKG